MRKGVRSITRRARYTVTVLANRVIPSPVLTGEEGPKRSLGGEGLYTGLSKTLTPQAFGLGPPSPAESGRGN